jgi:nucleotide-binding universal stress UspA family protein
LLINPLERSLTMLRILVAVDGSENALLATTYAIGLASVRDDVELHLVNVQAALTRHAGRHVSRRALEGLHAVTGGERLAEARRRVDEAGVAYRTVILLGDPAQAVARYALAHGIAQIVAGTARKSTLLRLLTGSFTNDLVQTVSVPVAVVAGSRPGMLQRFGVPAGVGLGLTTLLLAD